MSNAHSLLHAGVTVDCPRKGPPASADALTPIRGYSDISPRQSLGILRELFTLSLTCSVTGKHPLPGKHLYLCIISLQLHVFLCIYGIGLQLVPWTQCGNYFQCTKLLLPLWQSGSDNGAGWWAQVHFVSCYIGTYTHTSPMQATLTFTVYMYHNLPKISPVWK